MATRVTISRRNFLATLGSAWGAALLGRRSWAEVSPGKSELRARLAADPLRPQYHLLPASGWMNDPCGPIYAGGLYHMFFQYNPEGAYWGDMHWAHATSPDMIHWRHQRTALAPSEGGYDQAGVFSGCAVLDRGTPTIIYTGVAPPARPADVTLRDGAHAWQEVQCMAASADHLRSWQKAPAPVIEHPPQGLSVTGFRDPCVWREGGQWMMGLGSGVRGRGGMVLLYQSSDLRRWSYLHPLAEGEWQGKAAANPVDSGEMWECPDFFPLGDRHVLLISTEGKVFWHVGRYEQRRFRREKTGMVDCGAYYAARSMVDREGNRILWGWIPERRPEKEYRAAGWAGVMSLPRKLSLAADGSLQISPAPALSRLGRRRVGIATGTPRGSNGAKAHIPDPAAEIRLEINSRRDFRMRLLSSDGAVFAEVEYRPERRGKELRLNHMLAALDPADKTTLRMFVDGSVLEVFAGSNTAITGRVYAEPVLPLALELEGASAIEKLECWQIEPISPDRLTS